MGSKRYNGVRFQCYSHDHLPPHVHAFYNRIEVILELRDDGALALMDRLDAISPKDAPRGYVRYIRRVAEAHYDVLIALWEEIHGTAN